MSLRVKTRKIATPVAASPARTLIQEFVIVLQGGLDFALWVVLNPCFPAIGHQPASDEVIIIGIELETAPPFGLETIQEQRILQDFAAECTCASRHTRSSPINAMSCGNLEVASLDVCSPKPIVLQSTKRSALKTLDSLAWPYTTNFRLLERSQKPGQYHTWPRDIVVRHDDDRGLHPGDGFADLNTLVCDWDMEDADIRDFKRFDKADELFILV